MLVVQAVKANLQDVKLKELKKLKKLKNRLRALIKTRKAPQTTGEAAVPLMTPQPEVTRPRLLHLQHVVWHCSALVEWCAGLTMWLLAATGIVLFEELRRKTL